MTLDFGVLTLDDNPHPQTVANIIPLRSFFRILRGFTIPQTLGKNDILKELRVKYYHPNRNVYQTNIPEFEVGNDKHCLHPENLLDVLVGHSDGRLGNRATSFDRHTKTLVGKLGKLTDPKFGGI